MKHILFLLILSFMTFSARAKIVKYELIATKGKINLSGKAEVDFALMLNGSIPSPTLEFTEGDEAEIKVINNIPDDELSIHWHGILLDPFMDGVPYVNTPPIKPGDSYTFKFRLRQHGTYWYHSHTNVQEQKGLYGGIIIHPKEKKIEYDKDLVLVLSDWSDEDANQILRNLRKDGDYYLYKKGTMRSWYGAIKAGKLDHFLYNEWTRMGGMDYSDVGYDAFLINGSRDFPGLIAHPGEKIRLRIINAAASSYFYVSLGDIPMNIIAMDGVDMKPTLANEFLIGMAETYDVLFEMPEHKNYEFKVDVQDGTGSVSTWIGMGEKVYAPVRAFPDMYATMDHESHGEMDHSKMDHGEMNHSKMDHGEMDHSKMNHGEMDHTADKQEVINSFNVNEAQALERTEFPASIPRHDVKLVLDGDMERYVWHINGKAIHQNRNILIEENEVVRFTFVNNTMMHHPMHLHGHFFRVINKHGEFSPMKHTVDVEPHTTKIIEFYTNEPGEWMLHCHNLYHLKTGMARVVKYSSFRPVQEIQNIQKDDPHLDDHVFFKGALEAATNHTEAQLNLMNTWNEIELRGELRDEGEDDWGTEGDLLYKRWFGKNTNLVAGGSLVEEEVVAVIGFGYRLPFLIESMTLIDHEGKLRLGLEKRFQWTKYIYTEAEVTFRQEKKSEFEISLMYQNNWHWAAGLMFTEESAGIGVEFQF